MEVSFTWFRLKKACVRGNIDILWNCFHLCALTDLEEEESLTRSRLGNWMSGLVPKWLSEPKCSEI